MAGQDEKFADAQYPMDTEDIWQFLIGMIEESCPEFCRLLYQRPMGAHKGWRPQGPKGDHKDAAHMGLPSRKGTSHKGTMGAHQGAGGPTKGLRGPTNARSTRARPTREQGAH